MSPSYAYYSVVCFSIRNINTNTQSHSILYTYITQFPFNWYSHSFRFDTTLETNPIDSLEAQNNIMNETQDERNVYMQRKKRQLKAKSANVNRFKTSTTLVRHSSNNSQCFSVTNIGVMQQAYSILYHINAYIKIEFNTSKIWYVFRLRLEEFLQIQTQNETWNDFVFFMLSWLFIIWKAESFKCILSVFRSGFGYILACFVS